VDVTVWTRHPDQHPDLPTAGLEELFSGCGIVSVDSDGLRVIAAERPDWWFAVDDFELADDGTVAIVGDRGLWSPHVAGITVEASTAMDDVVVRGVVQAVSGPC
jgi:hypothetical protein